MKSISMYKWLFVFAAIFSLGHPTHTQQHLQPFVDFHNGTDTLTWTDGRGQHLLFLEQSDEVWNEEGGSSQRLRATHWLVEGSDRKEYWSFEDGIEECPVDLEAKFLAAPRFTDLDNDSAYEVWFIIQKACKGDISPSEVIVIMMDEGHGPYRLVAEQLLVFPDGTTDGGTYDLADFRQLPKTYQDYAVAYLLTNYRFDYRD